MYGSDPSNHLKADHLAASVREGVAEQAREQHEATALHSKGDPKPRGRRWWRFWKR